MRAVEAPRRKKDNRREAGDQISIGRDGRVETTGEARQDGQAA